MKHTSETANRKEVIKQFLVTFLPLAILVGGVILTLYYTESRTDRLVYEAREVGAVDHQLEIISNDFRSIVADLMFISEHEIQTIIDNNTPASRKKLAEKLFTFSKLKGIYDQVRYLDETGMEIIRINFNNGSPYVVPEKQLQKKSSRYYFKDTFILNSGEVYVSPFDLNIENGKVEKPHKPVIRFGTPVFNKFGQKRGVALFNYLGKNLLKSMKVGHLNTPGQLMFLTSKGYWMISPNRDEEWGFMYDKGSQWRFGNRFPETWQQINHTKNGQFHNKYGLFSFTTIYPLLEGQKSSTGSYKAFAPSGEQIEKEAYYWKVVSYVPQEVLRSNSQNFLGKLLILYILLIILLAFATWPLTRATIKRKLTEEKILCRNRELALLNKASQVFISTLELDQVLNTIIEEVRRLLNVTACLTWLVDAKSGELICRQTASSQGEVDNIWQPLLEQKVADWVAKYGESVIIPDIRADERYFDENKTATTTRSIISVPLQIKEKVIGVLQVVDTEVNRFNRTDLTLLEPLAATASIAIENGRLYEQTKQDAATKTRLLNEVNHRVKNNLSAIIGLLYAERHRVELKDQTIYQLIMEDLVGRVQGLATVHSMLSASEWKPLLLSELTSQIIGSSLQASIRNQYIQVDVLPSPVQVTPEQAHNLALIINELTTNSIKYAWPEQTPYKVKAIIKVSIDNNDDTDTVIFQFRDNGNGYPNDVLRLENYNVGFKLVQNIVRHSLCGELSIHNDHGSVTTVYFKNHLSSNQTTKKLAEMVA